MFSINKNEREKTHVPRYFLVDKCLSDFILFFSTFNSQEDRHA